MVGLEWTPDAALRRLRALITKHRKAAYVGELMKAHEARERAVKVVDELAEWLDRGGEMPSEWDRWA